MIALFCSLGSFAQYSSGGFSLDEENLYLGVRFGSGIPEITRT